MHINHLAVAALLAALASPVAPVAAADVDGLLGACTANPAFREQTGSVEALGRVCLCFANNLAANASQSDLDLLARDLSGRLTDTERMAYETYEDLSAYAGQALSQCFVAEGLDR